MDMAGLFSQVQLLMGSIPLEEEGRLSSQRLLIEDALQPRALPLCSRDHVWHCNGCTHCSHILLNSIKPFYTGSPLRARAPPAYFTGGGRRSPLTGRPGRPFEPVDATAINYVSDGSLHCLGVGAKRNPICRRFLRRQAGSMVPRRGAMCKVRPQKASCRPLELFASNLHLGGSRYRRWPEQLPARASAQQKMPWDGAPPLGKRRPGRPPATWLCCWCRGEVCRGPPAGLHSAALGCAGGLQGDPVAIVSEPQWLVVGPVTPALHLPHHRINVWLHLS